MKLPQIFFSVEDGDTVYENPGLLERVMQSLEPSVRYFIHIKKYRKNSSQEQQNYMRGVVYRDLAEHTGYTKDEVHQIYGDRYLSYLKNGVWFVKSTKSLNTKEMEEYLSKVRQHASEFHKLYIPLPNETHFLDVG